MGVTDAMTKRALYCNELKMSVGHEQRAAMQWSRNHFGQLGRLAVCDTRSGATRVHGGEHGSVLRLGGAALLAAQGRPNSANRFELRVQRLAGLDLAQRVERCAGLLGKLDQLCAGQARKLFPDLCGRWNGVLHSPIIPHSVRLSTTNGIAAAIFSP